jgi:hypothetical protein
MKQLRLFVVAAIVILASLSASAQGRGYKIVVNTSNPVTSISREELSHIFLRKSLKFSDGRSASPVDLQANSSVREVFSKDIHHKAASAVDAYWQQQIFSGKDIPPPQKSEKLALDFVRSNGNGISYVSAGASTEGLKVLTIVD